MANKPDEKQLVDLIAAAFDRLPDPAPSRLKAVEDRLESALSRGQGKRRTGGWYWWLIAALVATGAAAWWAGEHLMGESTPVAPEKEHRNALPSNAEQKSDPIKSESKSSPTLENKSREIYRRERF